MAKLLSVFFDQCFEKLETPFSLLATLARISNGKMEYQVERYSRNLYLARISLLDPMYRSTGTSLETSPWLALTKAHSELVERNPTWRHEWKLPTDAVCGQSTSMFQKLAAHRAELELFERDALVNFWASGLFTKDISDHHEWKDFPKHLGLNLRLKVYVVPSHKHVVTVALLMPFDSVFGQRILAVGCSAAKAEETAARAAVKEALMLALNDPLDSVDSPSFGKLHDQNCSDLKNRHLCDLGLRNLTKISGFYTTHLVYSAKLSGIRNGTPYISQESFEVLFGRIKPREPAAIPYFTK